MSTTEHYRNTDLTFALEEDLGDPSLFVGRVAELEYLLRWIELAKRRLGQSRAIMARKRRGKTALVQRLFNILYTRNDPQVIPFYIRIEDRPTTELELADLFYRQLISHYLGHKLRQPELIRRTRDYHELRSLAEGDSVLSADLDDMERVFRDNNPQRAWYHARWAGHRIASLKEGERIIQIIDEFQFLNEYVYTDASYQIKIELAGAYQSTGDSKISPLIITGSYIGWLAMIIRHMVDRFGEYMLGPLEPDEALAAVHRYSNHYRVPVTEESAAYIVEVCHNDPFYIAALFESEATTSPVPGRNLREPKSVQDTLMYELSLPTGNIARMWQEYTWHAFDKLNDKNAKKIVLYLARHGEQAKSRKDILEDLKLDISDRDLELLLHKLWRVDMVAQTGSNYDYKGLGDAIFAMVFRRMYQREIEAVDLQDIDRDIERKLAQARGQVSFYKGRIAEYRVVIRLLLASLRGVPLRSMVRNCPPELRFGPFLMMRKKTFSLDLDHSVEVDIFGKAANPADADLVVEVKDWKQPVTQDQLEKFVQTKNLLQPVLTRPTGTPAAGTPISGAPAADGLAAGTQADTMPAAATPADAEPASEAPAVGFLFYSEHGLTEAQETYLAEHGIMCSDAETLKAPTLE